MTTHEILIETHVSVIVKVTADMTPQQATQAALEALRSEGGRSAATYSADYRGRDLDEVEISIEEVNPWDGAAEAHVLED